MAAPLAPWTGVDLGPLLSSLGQALALALACSQVLVYQDHCYLGPKVHPAKLLPEVLIQIPGHVKRQTQLAFPFLAGPTSEKNMLQYLICAFLMDHRAQCMSPVPHCL